VSGAPDQARGLDEKRESGWEAGAESTAPLASGFAVLVSARRYAARTPEAKVLTSLDSCWACFDNSDAAVRT
jgi:hypothetical protein